MIAFEKLLSECDKVLGFSQTWQSLTPGDLADLRRATDAARTALSSSASAETGQREALVKDLTAMRDACLQARRVRLDLEPHLNPNGPADAQLRYVDILNRALAAIVAVR